VKTRLQSLSFLATLVIALGMIAMGSTLHAQNSPSNSPDRQAQQPSQSPDTQSPPPQSQQPPSSQTPPDTPPQQGAGANGAGGETQVFSGTVVKAGDKYVLKDDSGHTYDIDHQDEVKKFEGKRVRVQGTLDAANNKIMVK
jgi:hemolysin activation/secretion protein